MTTVQARRIESIGQKVRRIRQAEVHAPQPRRSFLFLARWAAMLWHEFVKDDVKIRSESMAFLMIFSLLPLIAGGFFLFNVFAQFDMVQDALGNVVTNFLSTIPDEHREFVQNYILQFKNAYLQYIAKKSGTIGIFAVFILMWVGLSTFNNVDRTLNIIWSSDKARPLWEQVRNFLVVVVAAPLVLISAFSVPLVLHKLEATRYVLDSFPILSVLMNAVLVPTLLLGTFAIVYRFVPVKRVKWKSAIGGAVFAVATMELMNQLMRFYFKFATNTAYGKAGVAVLVLFWLYVMWIVIILGAEVSYLMQNGREMLQERAPEPTFREGEGLVLCLIEMAQTFREGQRPSDADELRGLTGLTPERFQSVVDYLLKRGFIAPLEEMGRVRATTFVPLRDVTEIKVRDLLAEYFRNAWPSAEGKFAKRWVESLDGWLDAFGEDTIGQFLARRRKTG